MPNLGSLSSHSDGRDAIQLAVFPVQAGTTLYPGQAIFLYEKLAFPQTVQNNQIIVDPFLPHSIARGDFFWACLRPGAVASLRHIWVWDDPHEGDNI